MSRVQAWCWTENYLLVLHRLSVYDFTAFEAIFESIVHVRSLRTHSWGELSSGGSTCIWWWWSIGSAAFGIELLGSLHLDDAHHVYESSNAWLVVVRVVFETVLSVIWTLRSSLYYKSSVLLDNFNPIPFIWSQGQAELLSTIPGIYPLFQAWCFIFKFDIDNIFVYWCAYSLLWPIRFISFILLAQVNWFINFDILLTSLIEKWMSLWTALLPIVIFWVDIFYPLLTWNRLSSIYLYAGDRHLIYRIGWRQLVDAVVWACWVSWLVQVQLAWWMTS